MKQARSALSLLTTKTRGYYPTASSCYVLVYINVFVSLRLSTCVWCCIQFSSALTKRSELNLPACFFCARLCSSSKCVPNNGRHAAGKFEIRELAWDEVPKPSSRESSEEELLNAVPFVERAPLGPPTQHPPIPTRAQRRPRGWLGQQQRQQPLPTSKPRASVTDKAAEGSNTNAAAAAAAAAAGAAGMPITPQRGVVDGGSSAGTDTFENSDATDMHAAHALADGQEGMFDDSEAAEAAAAVLVGAEEGEGSVGRGDSDYIAEEAETRDGSDVWGEGQGRGGSSGRHM